MSFHKGKTTQTPWNSCSNHTWHPFALCIRLKQDSIASSKSSKCQCVPTFQIDFYIWLMKLCTLGVLSFEMSNTLLKEQRIGIFKCECVVHFFLRCWHYICSRAECWCLNFIRFNSPLEPWLLRLGIFVRIMGTSVCGKTLCNLLKHGLHMLALNFQSNL